MDRKLKRQVMKWIINQLRNGQHCFDIYNCTEAIGLDPDCKFDRELVDEIIQWNQRQLNQYLRSGCDENT